MKFTQDEIIINVLKDVKDWIPSYNLIKVNTKWGWLGSSGDRAARDLAEHMVIQRKREGKYTYYKWIEGKQLSII